MSADQLVKVPQSEWTQLRDLYRRDWPSNMIGFYTVDTFVRWTAESTQSIGNLAIYSLNGDWRDDGTFLCVHRYQLFANTLDTCVDRLHRALQLLDWSHGFKVSTLCDRFRPAVQPIYDALACSFEFDSLTRVFHMPKEQAIELDLTCPTGITLGNVGREHATLINDLWPNRHQGSLFFIQLIIQRSPTVGAFDADGQLVAWCLRLQAGAMGVLQVRESHQKRGLGLLVCKAFARKLAGLGMDSFACVGTDNVASLRTFGKAGFRIVDNAHWIRHVPSDPVYWID